MFIKKYLLEKKNIMEKKSFMWWVIFILLAIWQLPQTIVGLVMMPFLGKKRLVADRHFNFAWEGELMSGGISLGPFAYVSTRLSQRPEAIAHEVDGHTVDSKILGPLYLFIIGIPSLMHAAIITKCYYDFYTEKWANNHAGLEVDEFCYLHFKK